MACLCSLWAENWTSLMKWHRRFGVHLIVYVHVITGRKISLVSYLWWKWNLTKYLVFWRIIPDLLQVKQSSLSDGEERQQFPVLKGSQPSWRKEGLLGKHFVYSWESCKFPLLLPPLSHFQSGEKKEKIKLKNEWSISEACLCSSPAGATFTFKEA